ncbi:hypothetical protein D6764_03640 [Candidatus Woesearchaeota archaeon]|nr:MAG: hypothetical protein D6764_03640 [Candidatus Woesearchaeota archaeon]
MPTLLSTIGFLGVLFIALSWVPQTVKVFREKKTDTDLRFLIIYSIGSFLLLAYSILIADAVYILLNTITSVLASINLYFAFAKK